MSPKLQSIVIENFRSIRGKVAIPMNAQVVLIHGSNGMGKTSVLSALELGLTGHLAHLGDDKFGYRKHLTNFGADSGRIELKIASPLAGQTKTLGSVAFSNTSFTADALLSLDDARFFSERCFLPQSTLGRLLEIYDEKKTSTNSPLTLFVKELLGLDPLDALVDGLHPALHVSRLRNLVPELRRIEDLKKSLEAQQDELQAKLNARRSELNSIGENLSELFFAVLPEHELDLEEQLGLKEARDIIELSQDVSSRLQSAHKLRSMLLSITKQWEELPDPDEMLSISSLSTAERKATELYRIWSDGPGKALDDMLEEMKDSFPDILPIDRGPELSRAHAQEKAANEVMRLEGLLQNAAEAEAQFNRLNSTIGRATLKINELNERVHAGVSDVQALASALAGVTPHVSGENCPVCDRDFSEISSSSLAAHVASKIGTLTTEAGRLQAIAEEQAAENQLLNNAQREMLSVKQALVEADEIAWLRSQKEGMQQFSNSLRTMQSEAELGSKLMDQASRTRAQLRKAQQNRELSSSLLDEAWDLVLRISNKMPADFQGINEALRSAKITIEQQVEEIEESSSLRIECLTSLDAYEELHAKVLRLEEEDRQLSARLDLIDTSNQRVSAIRQDARTVSTAASAVRSSIVKRVFSSSLNTLWRDLFLRLAPSEQFVPAFKLPTDNKGNVEAILETLHRSGQASGSPGAILSQGNLNTAALTLFLALHLSVPIKQPWLVLDDPVQSMDDVHITQLAALLRTLSKGMNRQIVVAVHERALFDYLTLELSPSFEGDRLIAVEISKNFAGDTIVEPREFNYKKDAAIAA